MKQNEDAAPTAVGRAPMQQDSDLDPGPTPGDLLAWGSQAVLDVAAERRRQIELEGWAAEHDDEHSENEMALAAACYAMSAGGYAKGKVPPVWPWVKEWWKPSTARRDLVKAGALILAEIERLDRMAERQEGA